VYSWTRSGKAIRIEWSSRCPVLCRTTHVEPHQLWKPGFRKSDNLNWRLSQSCSSTCQASSSFETTRDDPETTRPEVPWWDRSRHVLCHLEVVAERVGVGAGVVVARRVNPSMRIRLPINSTRRQVADQARRPRRGARPRGAGDNLSSHANNRLKEAERPLRGFVSFEVQAAIAVERRTAELARRTLPPVLPELCWAFHLACCRNASG